MARRDDREYREYREYLGRSNAASPGGPNAAPALGWRRDAPPGNYVANHAVGTLGVASCARCLRDMQPRDEAAEEVRNAVIDGSVTPFCTQAPGSVFSIGARSVPCSGRDHNHNNGSDVLTLTVPSAPEIMSNLEPRVSGRRFETSRSQRAAGAILMRSRIVIPSGVDGRVPDLRRYRRHLTFLASGGQGFRVLPELTLAHTACFRGRPESH
jgi:hypothetical protein